MIVDDLELINKCKANSSLAFETLYKKYYRVLYGIALRYTKNTAEAEDVIQDSFIKIFNNINSYQPTGSFEGWLKRIVQNTAIKSYRSNLKQNLHVNLGEENNVLVDENFNTIFNALENKEVIILLNSMPEGYRIILNLYCIDGYSHKEISEILHIAEGTSKSQLFKAKNYLKNLLGLQLKQQMS